jgi:exonuclease SbcD
MRFIHTADWHLGRLFHNVHLTHDQEIVLLELIELVEDVKPHAVLVAGDLYDRAVPPTDAVELLDEMLTRIVLGCGVPVVAIAGNHDSPKRVGFGSALLRDRGLHLVGRLPRGAEPVVLGDEHGPVHVHALPFADPPDAAAAYQDDAIHDQQAVLAYGTARALRASTGCRRVALAHAFVAGAQQTPDSERPLTVGGAGSVTADVFAGFDYVALGHLHRPQRAGADGVRYAGSLMKYSFAEHDHVKSVSVVELGAPGSAPGDAGAAGRCRVSVDSHSLSPRRDVRRVEGTLADLIDAGRADPRRDDYLLASLLDTGAVLDAIGRLRRVYPNILAIERPVYEAGGQGDRPRPRPGATGDIELFDAFYSYVTGQGLEHDQREVLGGLIDAMERRRRESGT